MKCFRIALLSICFWGAALPSPAVAQSVQFAGSVPGIPPYCENYQDIYSPSSSLTVSSDFAGYIVGDTIKLSLSGLPGGIMGEATLWYGTFGMGASGNLLSPSIAGRIKKPRPKTDLSYDLTIEGIDPDAVPIQFQFVFQRSDGSVAVSTVSSTIIVESGLAGEGEEEPPPPSPTPTPTPEPSPTPGSQDSSNVWISPGEIMALPMSGAAWEALRSKANSAIGTVDISDQDNPADINLIAKVLFGIRTNNPAVLDEAKAALLSAPGTEAGGRTLALARNLTGYVIAADLLPLAAAEREFFDTWLRQVINTEMSDGRTLIEMTELRPNNWGTHGQGAVSAAMAYLEDEAGLGRVAQVLRGYLGERSVYNDFSFGELCWQADPSRPVGVNPVGSTLLIDGIPRPVDGVLPDDQRRAGCELTWPPPKENYVWEALQGVVAAAVILDRKGFTPFEWSDQAILRAVLWLHTQAGYPAEGDDTWIPHLINKHYGTLFPAPVPSRPGKNMGWTDWTHH